MATVKPACCDGNGVVSYKLLETLVVLSTHSPKRN